MSPRPLTRKESQARTREKLVQAAERVFIRRGYHASSIEQIAKAAGYTIGAVYSNFAGKDELGLAVLDKRMVTIASSLQEALAAAPPTVAARLEALGKWWSEVRADEDWIVLATEFVLATRKKTAMRNQLAQRLRAARALIAAVLTAQHDEVGTALPMEPERLAAAILGLGAGLGIQRIADPSVSNETFVEALALFLDRTEC